MSQKLSFASVKTKLQNYIRMKEMKAFFIRKLFLQLTQLFRQIFVCESIHSFFHDKYYYY